MAINEGPCSTWAVDTSCCPAWATTDPVLRAKASDLATRSLWAKTGRRYDLCTKVVRPCGAWCSQACDTAFWSNGTWFPYIFDGVWRNCWCGDACCSCEPTSQVWLPGPANTVSQVLVDGVAVNPANYRVDDAHWLVGLNGQTWPSCVDMDVQAGTGLFQVTYALGISPPPDLLWAAGILACEYLKLCCGETCRLPGYATTVERSGVVFTMPDPMDLQSMGLTGIWEVDQVILDLNPYGQKGQPMLLSPDIELPRQQTWP